MIVKHVVHSSEANFMAKLSLGKVLDIIQDMVTETLGETNFDNVTMREKHHAMWVYTHNLIKSYRLPFWNEEITISCECLKANKLKNYMITKFIDKDGNLLLSSIIELVLIDVENFKLIRLPSVDFPLKEYDGEINFDMEELEYTEKIPFTVSSLMIDYSYHLNNVQSILIYLNSFTLDELKKLYVDKFTFDIRYSSQGLYGETLLLEKANNENTYCFRITKKDEQNVLIGCIKLD